MLKFTLTLEFINEHGTEINICAEGDKLTFCRGESKGRPLRDVANYALLTDMEREAINRFLKMVEC